MTARAQNHEPIQQLFGRQLQLPIGRCRQRRPPVPRHGHIAIMGLGGVGRRVAGILHQLHLPLVGVTSPGQDPNIPLQAPVIKRKISEALGKINLATAKSVVTVTRDDLDNLEVALMARQINPRARLVIRTFDSGMDAHIAKLFPDTQVLCTNSLATQVFTGAAFGEHILGLFRMGEQPFWSPNISSRPGTRSAGYCSPRSPTVTASRLSSTDRTISLHPLSSPLTSCAWPPPTDWCAGHDRQLAADRTRRGEPPPTARFWWKKPRMPTRRSSAAT